MIRVDAKTQLKIDIIGKVFQGNISIYNASKLLRRSPRTIERYLASYRRKGILFAQHGNANATPRNKTSHTKKKKIQTLIKNKYYDFNITHLKEKLSSNEGITIGRETLRKFAHEIHCVKRKKRRKKAIRKRRDRMPAPGLLLQLDGSTHQWFGNKKTCLMAIIDDANSEVWAEFFPAETTNACMNLIRRVIEEKGVFKTLYVDRAGIYGGPKRCHFSQVQRACKEIGIEILYANSPEAKGRIERSFDTFQDRLIPELRLKGIKNIREANKYLRNFFIPKYWCKNVMVRPEIKKSEYKKLGRRVNLDNILIQKHYRKISNDHTFSYEGRRYLIKSLLDYSLVKKEVEIRVDSRGEFKVFFADKRLKVTSLKIPKKISTPKYDIQRNIKAVRLALNLNNISKASRKTGVSRQTIYAYKKMLKLQSSEDILKKFSIRRKKSHLSGKIEEDLLIFSFSNPSLGEDKVAAYIRQKYKVNITSSSVRNIWIRHGMQTIQMRVEKRENMNRLNKKAA